MDKTLLDKVTEDGMVKCYSESEILNRKIVGRGGFGVVYKAKLKHTGVTVAMKMLLLDVYVDEQELYKKFVNELKAHKKVDDHPNVIRFLGLCKDADQHYHMIFEFADGGSLRAYLVDRFKDLTWKEKYNLGLGITNGLKYLHVLDIIHKDLSSANILIQEGVAKITDCGLSNMLKQSTSTSKGEGNTAYIDPVTFENESYKRGKKSDIFSLGVILWEVSSGKSPCEGRTQSFAIVLYRLKGLRDPPFPETPAKYIELYSNCWNGDPDKRPSSEEVYKQLKCLYDEQFGKRLELSRHNIGDTEIIALAKALESNSSIQLNKFLKEIGYKHLSTSNVLESDFFLTKLNLHYNNIGGTGATALAKALESNSSLTILFLNNNNIGDIGAAALA